MARVNRSMSQITRPPASSTTPGSSRAIRPRFALSKSVRSAKSADIRVHAPVATTVDDSVQHSHIERWLGTRPGILQGLLDPLRFGGVFLDQPLAVASQVTQLKIGRASCRERV